MEAIGNTSAGGVPKNSIGERSHSTKPQSQQGPSLQPATGVRGVARDHTPDRFAQPEKPHVIAVKRKDTSSPSACPMYRRSLKIAQLS